MKCVVWDMMGTLLRMGFLQSQCVGSPRLRTSNNSSASIDCICAVLWEAPSVILVHALDLLKKHLDATLVSNT